MYNDYYGLSERPFQLAPDPRFWFESETHRRAMAYLGYGLAQGEGFVVITGDIGAGKTMLVGRLLETIDRNRYTVVPIAAGRIEGDDLLRLVAKGLGVDMGGMTKAQILDRIERVFDDHKRLGKRVLILADEVQALPDPALEELRMLSNYQAGGRPLVQIFLLGQPEFRDRLRDAADLEQLRQRVIATHHLGPMTADEVKPYVLHRLGQAGYSGNPAFSDELFERLHEASGGLPRLINNLMTRLLLYGALEQLGIIGNSTVAAVIEDAREEGGSKGETAGDAVPDGASDERLARLEARLAEQDAALRRLLGLLLNWIERDNVQAGAGKRSDAA